MLYAWGFSKNGQAGTSTNDKVLVPQNIPTKKQHGQIIDISAGGLFTAAITDKNYLLSFGCGKYGRLGSGDENDHKNVIAGPISSNSKLAKVKKVKYCFNPLESLPTYAICIVALLIKIS